MNSLKSLEKSWGFTLGAQIADTPRSQVWAATMPDGSKAALKVYTNAGWRSEKMQAAAYEVWDGRGAVRLLAQGHRAILMEATTGPTLGDMARAGQDARAAELLAETAARLATNTRPKGVITLAEYTGALGRLDASQYPAARAADLVHAQALLQHLLATAPAPQFLHGDLHHDNVADSDRGWLAYDPKAIWGEPHFEFANAFRNPTGMPEGAFTPDRFRRMADIFARKSGLDRRRLLIWAAAKAALSIAWFAGGGGAVPENQWPFLSTLTRLDEIPPRNCA